MTMDRVRFVEPLVKRILVQAAAFPWSIQGLGMLRLYLTDSLRLHVWDSRFRIPNVSPVHDHPWNFESYVIAGRVRQRRFRETVDGDVFNRARIKCGAGACVVSAVEQVRLEAEEEDFIAGQTYTMLSHEIHESFPEDGTVTLCSREFKKDRDHAHVYWRGRGGFVSAEPRPATDGEIVAITSKALSSWFTP